MNTLLLLTVLSVQAPNLKPLPKDTDILGEWSFVDTIHAGLSDFATQKHAIQTVVITKESWAVYNAKGFALKSKIRLDAQMSPPRIDIGVTDDDKPGALIGSYKINGDTLTVVTDDHPKERPTNFESPLNSTIRVMVFKRVKPVEQK